MPKSYLSESEKVGLDHDGLCVKESRAAVDAGDGETAWAWLAETELPEGAFKFLEDQYGSDWMNKKGFKKEDEETRHGKPGH